MSIHDRTKFVIVQMQPGLPFGLAYLRPPRFMTTAPIRIDNSSGP